MFRVRFQVLRDSKSHQAPHSRALGQAPHDPHSYSHLGAGEPASFASGPLLQCADGTTEGQPQHSDLQPLSQRIW